MNGLSRLGPDFDEFVRTSSARLLQVAVLLTATEAMPMTCST